MHVRTTERRRPAVTVLFVIRAQDTYYYYYYIRRYLVGGGGGVDGTLARGYSTRKSGVCPADRRRRRRRSLPFNAHPSASSPAGLRRTARESLTDYDRRRSRSLTSSLSIPIRTSVHHLLGQRRATRYIGVIIRLLPHVQFTATYLPVHRSLLLLY